MNARRLLMLLALLAAACGRQEVPPEMAPPNVTDTFPDDQFLTFPNAQNTLPPGDYTLVAETLTAGSTGAYDIYVTFDDGRVQHFSGSWPGAGGVDSAVGNPQALRLTAAGGLNAVLSRSGAGAAAPRLQLKDRNGAVVAQADGVLAGETWRATLSLPHSKIGAEAYSLAYYATLDPLNSRDSFDKWKQATGFGAGDDAHVIFLDKKDLGYGRNMHMRRFAVAHTNPDSSTSPPGVAVYVENFLVNSFGGYGYSDLSLDAAIAHSARFQIGINAIEWGPVDANHDGQPDDLNGDGAITALDYVAQFYTFSPTAPFARQLTANMDGKGAKAMPTTCISCHGGRVFPLLPSGKFSFSGDTRARLQPLDLDFLGFSTQAGYSRAEQEAGFKLINLAVRDSYLPYKLTGPSPPAPALGWNSNTALAMIEKWYDDPSTPAADLDSPTAHGGFVPDGWMPNASSTPPVPAGADQLYAKVLGPYCMTCHLLRGSSHERIDTTTTPNTVFSGNDVSFVSYDKFLRYAPAIQGLVFDRGNMPLARLPYEQLHADTAALELLASFIPNFNRRTPAPESKLLAPGRPVASAGPARTSPSPVQISGAASVFADQYLWRIDTQPAGSTASLDDPTAQRVQLTADTDGAYVLKLKVGKDGVFSPEAAVTVTIKQAMSSAPKNLTFETDIKPLLAAPANCAGCHTSASTSFNTGFFLNAPAVGEDRKVYDAVRARIDFVRPDLSPLLTKPTGSHHFGGQRPGFNTADPNGRANYDLLLNWILEGAREN